jgi:ParB family chromosome partitioning protein
MAKEMKSLGRGLAALIGEVGEEMGTLERKGFTPKSVPVEFLRANPRNPRKVFDDTDLSELTQSIKDRGIIQPIVVRPITNTEQFEIVAGERRWRAAQKAGLHRVPVVVVHIDDKTSLEYAILENVQRADLNPIEEAEGYSRLMAEFSYTQENLSKIIGKSRSHIANMLRLAELPAPVRKLLIDRQITAGHGRALLSVNNPVDVAKRIVSEGMSVRQVEEIAQNDSGGSSKAAAKTAKSGQTEKDPDTRALEKALQDVLGLTVSIDHKGKGGELRIQYKTLEQLDGLCRRLNP